MRLSDEQEMRLERIEYELSVLYSSISPLEVEMREKIWDAWNLVMDTQSYIQEKRWQSYIQEKSEN